MALDLIPYCVIGLRNSVDVRMEWLVHRNIGLPGHDFYSAPVFTDEKAKALESGKLARGGVVTEGSAGSTAISLATVASAYGCRCHAAIPYDAVIEKSQILEALGATVERVRPVSIMHRDHFANIARRRATEADKIARK